VEDMTEPRWRKSSHSGNGGANCVEVAANWRKSSYSGNGGGDYVEAARNRPDIVLVRDSKDRKGPKLALSDQAWSAFVQGIKQAEFGL
jgi:Domain of unknown function (DUF397)